jgi:hypothetical protein
VKPITIISKRRLKKKVKCRKTRVARKHYTCPKTIKNEYYTFFTQDYKNNKQAKSHMFQKHFVTFVIFSSKTIIPRILQTKNHG